MAESAPLRPARRRFDPRWLLAIFGGLAVVLVVGLAVGFGLQVRAIKIWRHEMLLVGVTAGAVVTVVLSLMVYLWRLLARVTAAEAALRARFGVLEDAIEAVPDGFVLYDAADHFVLCNTKYRELSGIDPQPGASYEDNLRGAISAAKSSLPTQVLEGWVAERLRTHRALTDAAFARATQQGDRWLRISEKRTRHGGTVSIHADVTEMKQAETAAEAARAAADEANRAKSDFLANMSHEIRTPMNGIMGMNGVLLESNLDEEQRQCAQMVQDSAEALLGILNDILDVSKLEVGRIDLETIDFDLHDVVERAMELMSARAREKKIEIGAYIDPAVKRDFAGDPGRLRQILLNLVGNAIKFTDHGSVSVEVTREEEDETGTRLRFAVMDTGIGISDEAKAKLFQKFSQADQSITRRFGGTGLGLSISKQLVELMGGAIGVESQPGKGSTFWFTVRLADAESPVQKHEILPDQLRNLQVLVVDDTEMNRRILERQLVVCGMRVTCVEDGFAGIAELDRAWHKGQPYDLLLLDQMMPGMSGEAVAKRVRSDERLQALKIVLASSMGVPEGARDRETSGFDAVLVKPVRRQSLLDSLARLYGAHIPRAVEKPASVEEPVDPDVHSGRILVADDNQVNQQIALKLLRRAGYTVDIAGNGLEAVAATRRNDYDLILMDVQMPSMDGVEATRKIRAMGGAKADTPIIALTAHAMRGAREEYLDAGMDDYITKPFDRRQFLAAIRRWMDLASADESDSPPTGIATMPAAPEDGADGRELPVFDDGPLAELAQSLPAEDLHELIGTYLSGAARLLTAVESGTAARDLAGLAKVAHSLISTSGNFGARQVEALARRLESACKAGDFDRASEISVQMRPASEQAWAALRGRFSVDSALS